MSAICQHNICTCTLPQVHISITFTAARGSYMHLCCFVSYITVRHMHLLVLCCIVLTLFCSEGYGAFCRSVKMLFLEVVSVLCFGQGSYEPPTPELIELLMKQIFKEEQVTQDLTPLAWEEADSNPVVRSVLLQLILMGRCVALRFIHRCLCFYSELRLTTLQHIL